MEKFEFKPTINLGYFSKYDEICVDDIAYEYDDTGKRIRKFYKSEKGNTTCETLYTYDTKGRLLYQTDTECDLKGRKNTITMLTSYQYDKNCRVIIEYGNAIGYTYCNGYSSTNAVYYKYKDDKIIRKTSKRFYDQGKETSITNHVYKYERNKMWETIDNFNCEGHHYDREIHIYEYEHDMLNSKCIKNGSYELLDYITYKYNKNKQLIRERHFSDNAWRTEIFYTYNMAGLLINVSTYQKNEHNEEYQNITYKYDDNKNLIHETRRFMTRYNKSCNN